MRWVVGGIRGRRRPACTCDSALVKGEAEVEQVVAFGVGGEVVLGDQVAALAVAVLLVLGEGGAVRVVQRQLDVAVVGDFGEPGDDGAEGAGVDDRA